MLHRFRFALFCALTALSLCFSSMGNTDAAPLPAFVHSLEELLRDAASPFAAEAYSPLEPQPFLCVDLDSADAPLDVQRLATLRDWLSRCPCPTIALATAPHPLAPAFDVVLADTRELERIVATIRHAPQAALVLVQVLRSTETLTAAAALPIESLGYATLQTGPEFRRWLAQRTLPEAIAEPGPPLEILRDGARLQLRLNRPANRNAIDVGLRDALCEALQLIVADPTIERVHVAGNGGCFSIGGALEEFGSIGDGSVAHAIRSVRLPARLLAQCAERVEFHVHSACIGAGAEIPAFGARVTASRNAFFQLPELQFGLIPGAGGCVSIPRRIGRQRTAYMALSMKRINAATALEWGLIDAIV